MKKIFLFTVAIAAGLYAILLVFSKRESAKIAEELSYYENCYQKEKNFGS